MRAKTIISACLILGLTGCTLPEPTNEKSVPITHGDWDKLLKTCVDIRGDVDYECFHTNLKQLDSYLSKLSENVPNERWGEQAKIAYWVNAYNAYTVRLIVEHYPIGSIKDIGPDIQLPRINTPWQIDFIPIGEGSINLDDIEHGILRKRFSEPRIHFALVCAARSCPKLRNEAYTAQHLEEQLTEQARDFLNDPGKNRISANKITLSKIFLWYRSDFKDEGQTLIGYLNRYAPLKIEESAHVSYMDYDWELNQPGHHP